MTPSLSRRPPVLINPCLNPKRFPYEIDLEQHVVEGASRISETDSTYCRIR
jgi:hypothetical protein